MTLPKDALFFQQNHHYRINVFWDGGSVWDDYTGEGVRVGVFDNGIQANHPDLDGNFDASLVFGPTFGQPAVHGTNVAGIIAAERNDIGLGDGGVGIAYNATIGSAVVTGTNGANERETTLGFQQNFDVVNHSWGYAPYELHSTSLSYVVATQTITNAVNYGRSGLGTVVVAAAGNDRDASWSDVNAGDKIDNNDGWIGNANANGALTGSRHSITVASVEPYTKGDGVFYHNQVAHDSNPGANILVSAPTNNVTTDLTGTNGRNTATTQAGGDYFQSFNGTSAATPVVSGVVALMLEANPLLGYRDVREILALSARHTGGAIGNEHNPNTVALPSEDRRFGHEVDEWATNGAGNWNNGGMHFSADYGFGLVDARAAIRLAETWAETKTAANEVGEVTGFSLIEPQAIPEYGSDQGIPVGGTPAFRQNFTISEGISVETISLFLGFEHFRVQNLEITLISPSGTRSLLTFGSPNTLPGNPPHTLSGNRIENGWTYNSNEFWGEPSGGTWTLEVRDTVVGARGSVSGGSLSVFGSQDSDDDTYFYTDEFATLAGVEDDGARSSLVDDAGKDTINAAAVTGDTYFDLASGQAGISFNTPLSSGTRTFTISGIENVTTGDGNDQLTGDAGANILIAGRGNDVLDGGDGADQLYGDAGNDHLIGGAEGDRLFGGVDVDKLEGGDGNDRLNGGSELDTLIGGAGDDTYILNDTSPVSASLLYDVVQEADNGGTDTILVSRQIAGFGAEETDYHSSYMLNANVENGVVIGTEAFDLKGNSLNNVLTGNAAANRLEGGEGDDVFHISQGNGTVIDGLDTIIGGAGSDTLNLQSLNRAVWVDLGYDQTYTDGKAEVQITSHPTDLYQGIWSEVAQVSEVENLIAGDFNDFLFDTQFDNILWGNGGDDRFSGRGGHDTFHGGEGQDLVGYYFAGASVQVDLADASRNTGEAADDVISADIEGVGGSNFVDALFGDGRGNLLEGWDGDDHLEGRGGDDTLDGGAGDDTLVFGVGSGADVIQAFGDNADNEDLIRIEDGLFADFAALQAAMTQVGTDVVVDLGFGNQIKIAGVDLSTLDQSDFMLVAAATPTPPLPPPAEPIPPVPTPPVPEVEGIVTTGTGGNNTLEGTAGDDELYGRGGNDRLSGHAGDDLLVGGLGRDVFTGGEGADTFDFNSLKEVGLGSKRDIINDFETGVDHIDLEGIDANTIKTGNQAFSWTNPADLDAKFTGDAGELRFKGGVLMGDTDGDRQADFHIKVIGSLAAGDVIL